MERPVKTYESSLEFHPINYISNIIYRGIDSFKNLQLQLSLIQIYQKKIKSHKAQTSMG